MRRPLMWCCIGLLILMALIQPVRKWKRISSPEKLEALILSEDDQEPFITVRGTAVRCSEVSGGVRLLLDHISIIQNDSEISLLSGEKLLITTEYQDIMPGDRLMVSGKFVSYRPATNPGQFDMQSYYSAENVAGMLQKEKVLQKDSPVFSLKRFLYMIRRAFRKSYIQILPGKPAGIISAISLGEKGAMEQEWKEVFQEGGIAHILAISGLHITLLGMGLYTVLRRIGLFPGTAAVTSGGGIFLYITMTGFSISSCRSLIMFLIWLGAQVWGRKYDLLTAVSLAAAFLVSNRTDNLYLASFWMSFGAVVSMGLLLPALERVWLCHTHGRALLSCIAIYLGTLPVVLYFCFQTSPWSVLVNLVVIPLMGTVMGTGLLAASVGMINVNMGIFLAAPVSYLLKLFEWLCTLEQKLPVAVWVAGRPGILSIVLYYGILGLLIVVTQYRQSCTGKKTAVKQPTKKCRGLILMWLAGVLVCIFLMVPAKKRNLQITCLDVGQGDCSLLQLPGGLNCLIDGGSLSEDGVWQYTIEPAIKYYGIRKLDYVFLSHADQDHINGVMDFLTEYQPGFGGANIHGISLGCLVLPPAADKSDFQDFISVASEKGIPVMRMEDGGEIVAALKESGESPSWRICCLSPQRVSLTGDRNEDSMVLLVEFGSFRMLFTGDLEKEGEDRLVDLEADLKTDVLKVGHHGSAGGTGEEFLEKTAPLTAVISCGENNRYGHPSPETVQRLTDAGCEILKTPKCGAVMIRTDGNGFITETFMDRE